MRGEPNSCYSNCYLCPKGCGVNRGKNDVGFCGMPDNSFLAAAVLHKGEEPPLIAKEGSGAVFFSGCTLGCLFCQNDQISNKKLGRKVSNKELSSIFLQLQENGASNINLITATQFTPSVIDAVNIARKQGLTLPIMWNSSGYEKKETVKLLSETVNIWLPDLKTLNSALAKKLFNASEYPQFAKDAILQMLELSEKCGGLLIENNEMKKGLILRHLVIPKELESTKTVLKWFAENLKGRAMLSLMVQYTPVNDAGRIIAPDDYIMPQAEYNQLLDILDYYKIDEGFIQEPEAASKEWIPDFLKKNPFPDKYSKPIWHWVENK